MKTAFALAFLAAGAQAQIGAVTAEWKAKDHVAATALQICASHTNGVASGAANTITYQYAGTCAAAKTTETTVTELKWGTGTNKANAEGALAVKATCLIDDSAKTVTCNTIVVADAGFTCVQLLKCRPLTAAVPASQWTVKSTTDTTAVAATGAAIAWAANVNGVVITKPTTTEAKAGAPEFTMELKVTATADIAAAQAITIVAPGYKFLKDGVCTLGSTASTKNAADSTGSVTFLSGEASGTSAKDLKCTKVQAVTAMAASQIEVISGGTALTGLTTVTTAGFVASPIIAKADPKTGSASTVSLSAAALLLAASMYL